MLFFWKELPCPILLYWHLLLIKLNLSRYTKPIFFLHTFAFNVYQKSNYVFNFMLFFGKELPCSILLYWHLLLINRLSFRLDGYSKTKDFLIIWFMYNDHMQKSNQWKNMWHTVILNVFAKYKTFFCVKRLMSFQYYIMLYSQNRCFIMEWTMSLHSYYFIFLCQLLPSIWPVRKHGSTV